MSTSAIEERWRKLEQVTEPLNEQCQKVLACFCLLHPRKVGFNELFRELRKQSPTLAKSTLSKHLKHLTQAKMIEAHEDKKSKLKIKPRNYGLTSAFYEIARDMLDLKVWSKETMSEALQAMRLEKTQPLTIFLIDILVGNAVQLLEGTLKYPIQNAELQRQVIYYHFENLIETYRIRVSERNEKERALKTIQEFKEFWTKTRNEKWLSLVKTMHTYKTQGGEKQNE